MPTLNFSVDSALLQELGERLVGKAYIALAELVKNSYDADSRIITIKIFPEKDTIEVIDKGNGMTYDEFEQFWMRIGSTHKKTQKVSRNLQRPLTGSKGIGRLAVQYLADEISITTVSEYNLKTQLVAYVKWSEAVVAGDLTNATVDYEIIESETEFEKGTKITLTELKHIWAEDQVQGLAGEIWWLQPPFMSREKDVEKNPLGFKIVFESSKKFEEIFNWQVQAIMNIWNARISGKNSNGRVKFALEYAGEDPIIKQFIIPNCELLEGSFEIRIYHLQHRQPYGIKVGEAREYLLEFGGVYVYDGGFQLPYYGDPKNDWLQIEFDHSHRLTASKLLPMEYRLEGGLQFLPTLSRVLGAVYVNTSKEPNLDILITRDRLQESIALNNLRFMIRYALDYYAYEERKRTLEIETFTGDVEKPKMEKVEDVLNNYKDKMDTNIYNDIKEDIKSVVKEIETEAEIVASKVSMLGPLATAGISSIAVQHETKWQINTLDDILKQIEDIDKDIKDYKIKNKISKLKKDLQLWSDKIKSNQTLYAYFRDADNLKIKKRFSAKNVVVDTIQQLEIISEGINIDTNKMEYCLLPKASLVEWGSIFQNVFLNAFNAMIDSKIKKIQVSTRIKGRDREILLQDTGCGVDLKDSEILFEPFIRKVTISPERQALGYGGTGLGLTIVRLIANNIGCKASFVKPDEGFSTAFSIRWREET